MLKITFRPPTQAVYDSYERQVTRSIEKIALTASDEAATQSLRKVRSAMSAARLGRLGMSIDAGSDKGRGGRVHYRASGFSASGWLAVRSRTERTLGTIEAYTAGTDIRPVKGRWLWIATDDIPSRVGKYRMTPERYRKAGLEQRIGPLEFIKSINGRPLLVVKNVGTSIVGKRRSAKNLTKKGLVRKNQRLRDMVVAFIGIPSTSRAARINVEAIIREETGKAVSRAMSKAEFL